MAASDEELAGGHTDELEDAGEEFEEELARSESSKASRLGRTNSRHKLASAKAINAQIGQKLHSTGHGKRNSSKGKKERAIQQARAFKELDITMEVLGIEGNKLPNALSAALTERPGTAASDGWLTPGRREDSVATPRASTASSVRSLSARGSIPQAAAEPLSDDGGSAQRRRAKSIAQAPSPSAEKAHVHARRQHSSPALHHRRSSSALAAAAANSAAASAPVLSVHHIPSEKELQQLQADRENWQQALSNVLEGRLTLDDVEVALQDATAIMEDLRSELVQLQDQPLHDWRACEQAVEGLEGTFRRAHDATRDLKTHVDMLETSGKVGTFADVLRDTMAEVLAACDQVTAAVELLLRGGLSAVVAGKEEEEARVAFRIIRRMLELLREFSERCRTNAWHFPELLDEWLSNQERAQDLAVRLCGAALGAVSSLQGQVLRSESLSSEALAHRVSAQAKLLALTWRLLWDLIGKASRSFYPVKISLNKELCQLYLQAASDAEEMQKAVLPDSDSDEELSRAGYATASVWGSTSARARIGSHSGATGSTSPAPGDDQQAQEIQAQGWVPGLLQSLLHRAQEAHVFMQDELARRDRDQDSGLAIHPDLSEGEEDEVCDLLDLMQDSFCHLALANTRRTAHLCAAPQLLPFWALEILKEQSEAALRLVQEYDRSSLGPTNILEDAPSEQQLGLQLFQQLRHWTDHVINGHLRVKRLLKMKRADGEHVPTATAAPGQRRAALPPTAPARGSALPPAAPRSSGRLGGAGVGAQGQRLMSSLQAGTGTASSSQGGRAQSGAAGSGASGAAAGASGRGQEPDSRGSRGGRGGTPRASFDGSGGSGSRGGRGSKSVDARPPAQPRIVRDEEGWSSVSSRRTSLERTSLERTALDGRPPLQPRRGEGNSNGRGGQAGERRMGGRGAGGDGGRSGGSMGGRGRGRGSHVQQKEEGSAPNVHGGAGRGGRGGKHSKGGTAGGRHAVQDAAPGQQQKQQQQWQRWQDQQQQQQQQQQQHQQWVALASSPPSPANSTPVSQSPPQALYGKFPQPIASTSTEHPQWRSDAQLAERAASHSAASSSTSAAIPVAHHRHHSSTHHQSSTAPRSNAHQLGSTQKRTTRASPQRHSPPRHRSQRHSPQSSKATSLSSSPGDPHEFGSLFDATLGTPPSANTSRSISPPLMLLATSPTVHIQWGKASGVPPALGRPSSFSQAVSGNGVAAGATAKASKGVPATASTKASNGTPAGASTQASTMDAQRPATGTGGMHLPAAAALANGSGAHAQPAPIEALKESQELSLSHALDKAPLPTVSRSDGATEGLGPDAQDTASHQQQHTQQQHPQQQHPQQQHNQQQPPLPPLPQPTQQQEPSSLQQQQVQQQRQSSAAAARTASWAQVLSNQPPPAPGPDTANSASPFATMRSQALVPALSISTSSSQSGGGKISPKTSPFQSAIMAQLLSQGSGVLSERQRAEAAQATATQQQQPWQQGPAHTSSAASPAAAANGQWVQQQQPQPLQQQHSQRQQRRDQERAVQQQVEQRQQQPPPQQGQHQQQQQGQQQQELEQPLLQPAGPSRQLAVLRSIHAIDDGFWKIRWRDLEPGLVKKLGSGSYGQVYQGVYLNAEVAIKVLNIDWEDTPGHGAGYGFSSDVLECFKREVDFQRKLSFHPNVVRFIGACCEIPEAYLQEFNDGCSVACVPPAIARGVKLAIVMELCHLGSLYSMIGQARRARADLASKTDIADVRRVRPYGLQFYLDWTTRLEVARGAAAGVEYMHQHGVVHRDLTSYNLLLDFGKPWQAKVCDFNLSRMIMDGRQLANSGNPNSPGWQSPEMLAGRPYSKEADVFSFGVLLWEIVTLKEPWREETEGRQAGAPLYYIMNSVTSGSRLTFPDPAEFDHCLPEAAEVIGLAQQCWCQQPIERPTMSEVGMRLRDIIDRMKNRRRGSGDGSSIGSGNSRPGSMLPAAPATLQQQE